jgi:hypothetical protein
MEVMKRLEEQRADLFQQVGVYDGQVIIPLYSYEPWAHVSTFQKLYFAPQELLLPGGGTFQVSILHE